MLFHWKGGSSCSCCRKKSWRQQRFEGSSQFLVKQEKFRPAIIDKGSAEGYFKAEDVSLRPSLVETEN
jgi:hypothetical protein